MHRRDPERGVDPPEPGDLGTPEEAMAILELLAHSGVPGGAEGATTLLEVASAFFEPTGTEARLRLVEARYRALVEQIPAVTFLASLTGGNNEIYVSPQIESLLGFTQEEWLSNPVLWFRQLHPGDRAQLSREFADVCATGRPFRGLYRVFARDGRLLWVLGEARFVRDEAGRPLFLQGIAFDVTEQQRAQQTQQQLLQEQAAREEAVRDRARLHELFMGLPAATLVLRGPDHTVELLNPMALDLAGGGAGLIGRPLREVLPELAPALLMLDGIYASGAPFVAREWAARSARWGRDRYFDFSCQPLRGEHGEVAGLLIHLVEVTAQVNARTALERAAEERERLIAELQRTVKFSEMFVGILGHDLRNPLNAITTGATLLQRRSDSERVQQPAGRILNSAERMARMIDQLLDFTRIRLGRGLRLQRRTVALEDLCVAAADELRSLEAEIRLSSIGDTRGLWDSDRLIQLLSNLLANAIQHRHPGTPVDLKVDGTDPERVLIDVHNSGAVDPVLLPVMFEPFRGRDDHKVRGSSGLGLGLFITHQIAAAHKGRITVASSASDGTTLRVELPRNAPVTADEQAFTPSERVTS